jgi:transcriptional regulator with XRE-family HTH domain
MENKKIGKYLLQKRKEEAKTQKEVADDLGVTYQAVSRWENGDSIPDIETLCMIADMYHVTIDEILQRESVQQEKSEMILLAGMSVLVYLVAIITFIVINSIWLPIVGIGLFSVFVLGGLVPANIYYFGELTTKSKKDSLIYIGSYLPLLIGVIIIIVSLQGNHSN